MLLLEFLPNWVFHVLLIVGVLGLLASVVLKFIPVIKTYDFPVKVISILLIMTGVWFDGAMSNQAAWEARVAEMQVKVAEAEAQSEKTNVKIITKVVKQLELVRERGQDVIKYVDREVVKDQEVIKFVENCPIPQIVIDTHNAAALNQPIEGKK
jgi:translation elongation factor EF-Tu-like GTPase